MSRSSPIPVGDPDEVSSPTATQMRRAKRTNQQASRHAELSMQEFSDGTGLEGSGIYEEQLQEEPSSPCAAQIRHAKKLAQSHSGSSPGSTAYHEDSSPGSAPAFERLPQGGISQAELDAFSRHSVGEEDQWQGEAPSSPAASQLRRAKRGNQGTPPRAAWPQDSMGLGQEDPNSFGRPNRVMNAAHSSTPGQQDLTQLPSGRFYGGVEDFGSASDGHLSFPPVPEHSGSEEIWFAEEGPSSPQAQKHLRAKRAAQQHRGPSSHAGGEDPWGLAESRPEAPEAWPYQGASSSVGASSQSQFRTPPSPPTQSYGAGLTQAELDSLANHSPNSPVHSTSPPSERGTRRVEPDVGRPASSRSEIPPPRVQFSAGLSQAELNALCQEPRVSSHSGGRGGGLGDEEPVSPQASRMQQIRRAQQYAPVGGAPWA